MRKNRMGRSIYFTDKELQMVIDYTDQAIETLSEGIETAAQVDEDMKNGLGSAMRKLYKGRNGEVMYTKYKTKR